ncbi:hypothetical protein BDK51DRAFT_38235 [Blyttiomyces helicus]|uniref:Reverse transcriptase Ty1/copia-type domain-containing protein n=1 Tax=Blyttiomyces helicus TaxID=388810 RepID=A0A4P9W8G2_9FUNG|nr:hypothetical protein BDK51DRAFT_38235 [Blyttiomyces helicus]|eukprot:RKO88392.1 hypothetical protein BDK51DRAFT_38235 [Blyttiomyces helicus]
MQTGKEGGWSDIVSDSTFLCLALPLGPSIPLSVIWWFYLSPWVTHRGALKAATRWSTSLTPPTVRKSTLAHGPGLWWATAHTARRGRFLTAGNWWNHGMLRSMRVIGYVDYVPCPRVSYLAELEPNAQDFVPPVLLPLPTPPPVVAPAPSRPLGVSPAPVALGSSPAPPVSGTRDRHLPASEDFVSYGRGPPDSAALHQPPAAPDFPATCRSTPPSTTHQLLQPCLCPVTPPNPTPAATLADDLAADNITTRAVAATTSSGEPRTCAESDYSPDSTARVADIKEEFNALTTNSTWALVLHPPRAHPIGCHWIFKHKHGIDSTFAGWKSLPNYVALEGRLVRFGGPTSHLGGSGSRSGTPVLGHF